MFYFVSFDTRQIHPTTEDAMGKSKLRTSSNEYLSDTARQRKERQEEARELRRAERKAKKTQKSRGRTIAEQVRNYNMDEVTQAFVTDADSFDALQEAWRALHRSDTLKAYCPKFKYDEAKQFAVGYRSFVITLPFELVRRINKELSPTWRMGSTEQANAIIAAQLAQESD